MILATVTSADAMKAVIGGLTPTGTLMIVGAVPSLEVPALQLLLKSQQVKGWYSGTSLDSQETLGFQRALRGAVNERELPAGACERGLRTHDTRQSKIPRRADDGKVSTDYWKFPIRTNGAQ